MQAPLFDVYEGSEGDTFEDGWKNKLIWGDNLLVMGSLLEKLAGKIDLIYIDPPFATGADFSFTTEIGDGSIRLDKEASVVEEKAYRDTWGRGLISYMQMMRERLTLIRSLISQEGHLVVHVAPNVTPHLRLILDEIFGIENFRNEIVIHRPITKNLQRQFKVITALHKVTTCCFGTPRSQVRGFPIFWFHTKHLHLKATGTVSGVVQTGQVCDMNYFLKRQLTVSGSGKRERALRAVRIIINTVQRVADVHWWHIGEIRTRSSSSSGNRRPGL